MADPAEAHETPNLPPAGTYVVDPAHSSVTFVARHLVGSKVRGQFHSFSGTVTIAEPPEASSVVAEVEADSISTGVDQRDEHVRSADFLDKEHHPKFTLTSTGLTHTAGAEWKLGTELTVRGITRPVDFELEFLGSGPGMAPGSVAAAFSAAAEVDRRDFDVSFAGALDTGGLLVGNKVRIELEVEAIKS